jgi:hypothetical protein
LFHLFEHEKEALKLFICTYIRTYIHTSARQAKQVGQAGLIIAAVAEKPVTAFQLKKTFVPFSVPF